MSRDVSRHAIERGFTLIEMMIVVVIVAILAVIVLPSYQGVVMKARRTDAKTALTTAAQSLERYSTENASTGGYSTATVNDVAGPTVIAKFTTDDGYYRLVFIDKTATTYVLSAVPNSLGPQAGDPCKTFTLNQRGERGVSADALKPARECWQ